MIKITTYLLIIIFLLQGCSKNIEKSYYTNGQLYYTVPLKNGKRHGLMHQYYENGKLYLKSEWINGQKEGKTISYYENGNPITINIHKNGILSDSIIVFDSLTNIEQIIYIKSGMKNGLYKSFYPDGSLKVNGYFKNDKKEGKTEIYYSNGSIKTRKIFHDDTIAYEVYYTKRGIPFDIYLPISIEVKDSMDLYVAYIKLDYGFYDNGYIGVIIGTLNENFTLTDTIAVLNSRSNMVKYMYDKKTNTGKNLQGVLFEMDSSNSIKAKSPFTYNISTGRLIWSF